MKKLLSLAAFALISFMSNAQHDMSKEAAKMPSPPAKTMATIGGTTLTINYHQPAVKGRNVWAGDLAPYGKVWRTGANEATTFTTNKDIMFGGKPVPAGKYTLWTIPEADHWTVILNSKQYDWGVSMKSEASREPAADIAQVEVPVETTATSLEMFNISFDETTMPAKLVLAWDKTKVSVPLN